MLIRVYSVFVCLLSPLALLLFSFFPRGKARLRERVGSWGNIRGSYLWFHGASLGELKAIEGVLKAARESGHRVLVTATSITGLEAIQGVVDEARIVPFDCLWFYRRALKDCEVSRLIITETEIWPCLLESARRRSIPITMINGRLSRYSMRYYRLARWFFRSVFDYFEKMYVSSNLARTRFLELGADAKKIEVVGNTKYDIEPGAEHADELVQLKSFCAPGPDPILVFGSMRPGEEGVWFEALRVLAEKDIHFNVLLAPRHKERFDYFADALMQHGFNWCRWTELERGAGPADQLAARIVLVDTYGQLKRLYALGNLAFIGASLVDIGGHNPLEAAACSVPIVMGPYYDTVEDIVTALIAEQAIDIVTSAEDVLRVLQVLHEKPVVFVDKGVRARGVWKSFRGAGARIQEALNLTGDTVNTSPMQRISEPVQ